MKFLTLSDYPLVWLFVAFCSVLTISCKSDKDSVEVGIEREVCQSCAEPNLFTTDDGEVILSWLSHDDTVFHLRYSILSTGHWSQANTVVSGSNWFINWADFPSMAQYPGNQGGLAAHWLEMSAEGTYDYDVRIIQSLDKGNTWGRAFSPHRDGIPAEHGFVTLLPISEDRMFAAWLDGRNTKTADSETDDGHGHGPGAMTLRSAVFDQSGNLYDEVELDDRVCDCCQTSAAMTSSGIVVAYRDRSENEVRDISVVAKIGNQWTEPKNVYSDNWLIPGCPVNGPVVKASDNLVAVAWFGMKDTIPEVKVAFSIDDGQNFALPFRLDSGHPLGRVGLEFVSDERVIVTWIEQDGGNATIRGRMVNAQGPKGESFTIANTSPSRRSGFPVIARYGDDILAAWTVVGESLSIHSAIIHL